MEAGEEGETHLPLSECVSTSDAVVTTDRIRSERRQREAVVRKRGGGGGGGEGKAATRQPISCHYIYTFGD